MYAVWCSVLLSVSVVISVVTSKFTTLVKLFCKHYLENRKIYDLAIDFYNLMIWNYYNVPPILVLSGRIQIIVSLFFICFILVLNCKISDSNSAV